MFAFDVALAASISSVISSFSLVIHILPVSLARFVAGNDEKLTVCVSKWQTIASQLPPVDSADQRSWSQPLQIVAANALFAAAQNQTTLARLIVVAAPASGVFFCRWCQ